MIESKNLSLMDHHDYTFESKNTGCPKKFLMVILYIGIIDIITGRSYTGSFIQVIHWYKRYIGTISGIFILV